MRKNFTPEQMLHTVRQAESGTPVSSAGQASLQTMLSLKASTADYDRSA